MIAWTHSIIILFLSFLLLVSCENINSRQSLSLVEINTDLSSDFIPWSHYWENCVGSGHATLSLREDWRKHLKQSHDQLGSKQVRFHGIFDDDMSVVLEGGDNPVYSFFNVDQSYSFLLEIGMKPFVELSFMPELLASGNSTIFHYKGNTSPPSDYDQWYQLIQAFANHLIEHFGLDEVKTWNFEVWNEPNCGFWSSTQDEYYKLYNVTSFALKNVSPELQVGGPATCMSGWISEFLNYCNKYSVPVDFVSTHQYPTDIEPTQLDAMYQAVSGALEEISQSAYPNIPLYYSEFNDGLFEYYPLYDYTPEHDEPYAAAFAVKNIHDVSKLGINILSWWTFSDIFEEGGQDSVPFHGGFGMMTIHSIPKPSWRAFELLHQSGESTFSSVQISSNSSLALKTVGSFVTYSNEKNELMVFVYNHNVPLENIESYQVKITLSSISSFTSQKISVNSKGLNSHRIVRDPGDAVKMYLIDDDHCNPKKVWQQQMNSVEYPTEQQIQELQLSSQLVPEALKYEIDLQSDSLSFDTVLIQPQGVIVLQINATSIFSW